MTWTRRMIYGFLIAVVALAIGLMGWSFIVWDLPPRLPDWHPIARFYVAFLFFFVWVMSATYPGWGERS